MSREGISPWWIGGALTLTILGSVAAGYWLIRRAPEATAPPQMVGGGSQLEEAPPAPLTRPPEKKPLPALGQSDAFVRDMARKLSDHPQIAKWVAPDDLVRRLVASVDNVARGTSPRPHLTHMQPEGTFAAAPNEAGELTIDPRSVARYDLLTEVFISLDIGATVRLYYEMEPLLEEAYAELGDPSRTFAETLDRAVARLLETPIPDGEPVLEKHLLTYRYVDQDLEGADPAAKHLMRLGPENAERVKGKLRFLRDALDLGRESQENFAAAAEQQADP